MELTRAFCNMFRGGGNGSGGNGSSSMCSLKERSPKLNIYCLLWARNINLHLYPIKRTWISTWFYCKLASYFTKCFFKTSPCECVIYVCFICVYTYLWVNMCVCMYAHAYVCTCTWKEEVNTGRSLQSVSTLLFDGGSLPKPRAHWFSRLWDPPVSASQVCWD